MSFSYWKLEADPAIPAIIESDMEIKFIARYQPKAGNTRKEYEDAVWPPRPFYEGKSDTFRCAVADGATESAFSQLWARILVRHFCDRPLPVTRQTPAQFIDEIEKEHAQIWSKYVFSQPLKWFAIEKASRGSFASLTGIELRQNADDESRGGKWEAVTIGDSCLFQIRNDQLITKIPISDPNDFGYHPQLLSTDPAKNKVLQNNATKLSATGNWQVGDQFLLMTDALAHWFLSAHESKKQPWRELTDNSVSQEIFEQWIEQIRKSQQLRNDDVTAVSVLILDN